MENNNNQTSVPVVPVEQPVQEVPVQQPVAPVSVPPVVDPNASVSQPVPAVEQATVPVQGEAPKPSNKKTMLLALLGILLILAIIGVGVYYYMTTMTKKTTQMIAPPPVLTEVTQEPTKELVADKTTAIKSTSDLDSISTELSQADSSLEKALNDFDKDSNF